MLAEAAKPKTAVQDCVSTFVSVTLPDIFKKISERFPTLFVATKTGIFYAKTRSFPNPNQVFFVPINLTRQGCLNIKETILFCTMR